jgi:protein TonB
MTPVRFLALAFSLVLHTGLVLPFLFWTGTRALEVGAGEDALLIEQGIAIEGLVKLGDAETMTEAQNMPLAEASQAQPPLEEIKAVEPVEQPPIEEATPVDPAEQPVTPEQETVRAGDQVEVIAARDGPEQELESVEEVTTESLKPEELGEQQPEERPVVEDKPSPKMDQPRPEQVMTTHRVEQLAVQEQQSSSEEQKGGDASLRTAYLGKLRMHIERHKVRPQAKATGTAVVKFTVDASGKILTREITTSSGSKKLDDAAIATIERAVPFPPFPDGISRDPVVVSVPFKFRAGR